MKDLVATVGKVDVKPGSGNVIAGSVHASLDVRHADDEIRKRAVAGFLACAKQIGSRRRLSVSWKLHLDQASVPMDPQWIGFMEQAVAASGHSAHRMASGAGHDAMILATRIPTAMLFLRSPGGISHHPDESVLPEDVAAALAVGSKFLELLEDGIV